MQALTPRLGEAVRSAIPGAAPIQLHEGGDYFRIEASLDRAAVENLDVAKLEGVITLAPPDSQKIFLDVSALPSHEIAPADVGWQESLRQYIADARLLEEAWTAILRITISPEAIIRQTHLDTALFQIVPVFLLPTLLAKQQLSLREQLEALFPDRHKKTVFVVLDSELFCDGPFLCLTDWKHLTSVSYTPAAVAQAATHSDMVQQECSWLGVERIFLPEFLEIAQSSGRIGELIPWLLSLRGSLGICAIANVAELSAQTRLSFWGTARRQVILDRPGRLNGPLAECCYWLYSWVYHDAVHFGAALRIARNLVSQQLSAEFQGNLNILQERLPDILASAKANYAAFVEEKLKDFFTLGKEISNYTIAAAEYLYKTLSELNESLRKSVLTVLGVIGGALLSASAVQLNPLTYSTVLASYSVFLFGFNVWYLPSSVARDFADHLRHFRSRVEPYREFLSADQRREVFEDVPRQHRQRFAKSRRLVCLVNGALAGFVLCLSGFDMPRLAKSFVFVPTWALGRGIDWLCRIIVKHL